MSGDSDLEFACKEQRQELAYRRRRKRQIFIWSNSILLAVLAASLSSSPERASFSIKEGMSERILVSVLVFVFVAFTVYWQFYQRKREARHQDIISKIYDKMGLVDEDSSIYPSHWDSWGYSDLSFLDYISNPSRVATTALVGISTFISIWIDMIL